MNRQELAQLSEAYIKQLLQKHLPKGSAVYLFGSRARHDDCWNSDYDLWIDAEIAHKRFFKFIGNFRKRFVSDLCIDPQIIVGIPAVIMTGARTEEVYRTTFWQVLL